MRGWLYRQNYPTISCERRNETSDAGTTRGKFHEWTKTGRHPPQKQIAISIDRKRSKLASDSTQDKFYCISRGKKRAEWKFIHATPTRRDTSFLLNAINLPSKCLKQALRSPLSADRNILPYTSNSNSIKADSKGAALFLPFVIRFELKSCFAEHCEMTQLPNNQQSQIEAYNIDNRQRLQVCCEFRLKHKVEIAIVSLLELRLLNYLATVSLFLKWYFSSTSSAFHLRSINGRRRAKCSL